ncbi:MAG TPA: TatD family hydrolase [Spirochaetota bacterium]|nr:TatD family hydrolase [Spirochaetota bacterium]
MNSAKNIKILDAHIHLKEENISFPQENLYFLNSITPADWDLVLRKTDENHNLIGFLGIHPWHIDKFSEDKYFINLEKNLLEKPDVGVGEIGLDGYKNIDIKKQIYFFLRQLLSASKLKRKVSIHCAKAWDIFFSLISEYKFSYENCILHRFEASKEILKRVLDLGFFISFYYSVGERGKLQETFKFCPIEKILIESDSSNGPDDKKLNEHYEKCAILRNMKVEDFKGVIYKNGEIFKNNQIDRRR